MLKVPSENDLPSLHSESSLEEFNTITGQNGNNNSMAVSEFAYTSGEIVNFESAVNIDGSTDVIIGPVTQFHVNAGGNITIVQRDKINDKESKKALEQNSPQDDKLLKVEKSLSKKQTIDYIYNKKIIGIALILFSMTTLCIISLKENNSRDHHDRKDNSQFSNIQIDSVCSEPRLDDVLPEDHSKVLHIIHTMSIVNIVSIICILLLVIFSVAIFMMIFVKFNSLKDTFKTFLTKPNISISNNRQKEIEIKEIDLTINNEDYPMRIGNHTVFKKKDWFGYPSNRCEKFTAPVRLIIIKHIGAGQIADSFNLASRRLITIQSENMANGMPDIYCNFFIGGDGNIYVGRGWDVQPQFKKDSIDIVFSGNFDVVEPPQIMIDATQALINEGVKRNKIASDYIIVPHNQIANTRSPGVHLIKKIKTWPRYSNELFFHDKLPQWDNYIVKARGNMIIWGTPPM